MKKFFISAVAVLAVLSLNAKVFTVGQVQQVNLNGSTVDKPVISADGSFVVAQGKGGLQKIDLASGQMQLVAQGNDLYHASISPDGKTVVYTRPSFDKNHLRYTAMEAVNVDNGNVQTIVKASRNMAAGASVSNRGVAAINNGKVAKKTVNKVAQASTERPVVAINRGHLMVGDKAIDPQGKGSYLWPSLSPDGTKIVYWCVNKGCFVCDLDGSNAKSVGGIRAAVWAGNDALIGMVSEDNGEYVTASKLVAADLATGEKQDLTSADVIALFPTATANRVSFVDEVGNLYVMDINK